MTQAHEQSDEQVRDPFARHSASPAELRALVEAERSGHAFLALRDADGRLHLHPLDRVEQPMAIGRHPACAVAVGWDQAVSSLHAELEHIGGAWTIEDDGLSRNGTFVNEERVRGRRRLQDGDRIRVGQTLIVMSAPVGQSVEHTAPVTKIGMREQLSPAQRRVLVALCRPCIDSGSRAAPASNQQIADELFLSVDTVKMHLRSLFAQFGLEGEAQNQKRAKLAFSALNYGVVTGDELA